ncbi:MAG: hypothetical protein M1832_000659 [Thelocarpon impressellum]|nr:MAG: hypothetical protein M1832_000659 [Thelocarpon impressellum]
MAAAHGDAAHWEVHSFAGLLSDMDGTLVDSTAAIVKHWHKCVPRDAVIPSDRSLIDPEVILETSHGRRSIDTLQLYDRSLANWEYVSTIEGRIPYEFGQDAEVVPGARELLGALEGHPEKWAIVTSGTRPLLTGWLDVLKLAHPRHLVVAEDVERGKPDPACYNLGRERLGLASDAPVLVLEDSPAGVRSGKAAGCQVVGLATTHGAQQLREAGADWLVSDLRDVTFRGWKQVTGTMDVAIRAAGP